MIQRGEQAGCAEKVGGLESRVDQVVDACCIHGDVNTCAAGGIPSTCDAPCSLAYTPWYVECVQHAGGAPGGGNLQVSPVLATQHATSCHRLTGALPDRT